MSSDCTVRTYSIEFDPELQAPSTLTHMCLPAPVTAVWLGGVASSCAYAEVLVSCSITRASSPSTPFAEPFAFISSCGCVLHAIN